MNSTLAIIATFMFTITSFAESAVYFYKSKASPFPSGQSDLITLQNNLVKSEDNQSIVVEKSGIRKILPKSDFLSDIDVSEYVIKSNINKRLQVVKTLGLDVMVQDPQTGLTFKESQNNLIPDATDLGFAFVIKKTPLYKNSNWKSDIVIQVPERARIKVTDFQDRFFRVTWTTNTDTYAGYIENSSIILKHDFASFALDDSSQWIPVEYRLGDSLILKNQNKMKLKDVKSVLTRSDLAISIVDKPSEQLLPRQRWKILSRNDQQWFASDMKGHGVIYWKKTVTNAEEKKIFIEDLLKKEIAYMAVDKKNPRRALVSAHGIFFTEDGILWTQFKSFGDRNYPVFIDNKSHLLVGDQRSTNNGKTFYPFINWEQLTKTTQDIMGSIPKKIIISKISQQSQNTLRLEIDTGGKLVQLETLPIHIQ